MEFGITGALPQYSGGLGILAGDHLKSASDLAVPIVGVGLFYATGYFKQSLSRDGWQQETYPVLDPDGLPLSLLREADGSARRSPCDLPGERRLWAQVWKAQVGRVPLLLLDSDVEENDDAARGVTDRLYGGGGEHRLQQELLCGIGGVRALRAWARLSGSPEPEVYHTNEGHAGFLSVERIREHVERGLSFDEALEAVRAATVFTTHTPVPAGIDRFGRDQVALYFGGEQALPGCRWSGSWRWGPRTTRAATPASSTWPSWACASRSAPTGCPSCTGRSAAGCSTGCGRVRRPRGADRLHHQRRARPDVGGAGGRSPWASSTSARSCPATAWASRRSARSPTRRSGGRGGCCAPASSRTRGGG